MNFNIINGHVFYQEKRLSHNIALGLSSNEFLKRSVFNKIEEKLFMSL